jgi:hypothetical protein
MSPLTASAALVFALGASAPVFAQQDPAAPAAQVPEGRGGRAQGVRPVELAAMLDAWAIVQAQTAVQLNDNQFGEFVTRLKRLQDTRRHNMQARNRLLQQIRALVVPDATADEAAIREKLKALRDHDEQTAAAVRRDREAVDEVLDARQQALFRLFEERLERQKLDLLMRARDRAARGAAPSKPGPSGR